ncbi:hypothetical protein [Tychonema sp. LEGE 06208]|uniref:hypothetical protein n=1 Tax=Tychonema sp. LEGE 06208 TaxID=1828663 RepID=UPI001881688F|nr:hypothetical protein [Tychonema sp. LEGE 06208]MBE9162348.1 hypothetical protein [Tychonema sp. LEGE 06208]
MKIDRWARKLKTWFLLGRSIGEFLEGKSIFLSLQGASLAINPSPHHRQSHRAAPALSGLVKTNPTIVV